MDQLHELHSALLKLAEELGETPTKKQFFNKYPKLHACFLKNYNERYIDLCLAAGLIPNKEKKITNKIFEVNPEKHLAKYEQSKSLVTMEEVRYEDTAVISDIHWPFENKKVLKTFNEYVGDTRPKHVIVNGDARDQFSHGRFPRSHNLFTPQEEHYLSKKMNDEFWERILLIHPEANCIQTMGNHDVRPLKKMLQVYPEAEEWISEKMRDIFTFKGVKTIFDPREEVLLPGNIAVHHGYRSQLGSHRDFILMNSINGHSHVGGVVFRKIRGAVLWELNSGLAGDPEAKGLTYTPQKITNWTPGFGIVNKYGPQFIHV